MQSARVLTVSDGVAAGEREDLSGPALCERLRAAGFDVAEPAVVSDGIEEVAAALRELVRDFAGLVIAEGEGYLVRLGDVHRLARQVGGGAGKVAILSYTMPFWVIPMAWWVLGERVRGLQWVAIVIAASGLVLVLQPWSMGGSAFSNLLAVAGGVTWAASAVVAKRMRLDDLTAELARYRHGWLRCDPAIAQLEVSGVFQLDDIDRALSALSDSLPVRIERFTPLWTRVVAR